MKFYDELPAAGKIRLNSEDWPDEDNVNRSRLTNGRSVRMEKQEENEGYGVAITECFNSTVGQIVKVSRNTAGKIKIDHVWAVMDCGWYVNPDIIRAQVEGSVSWPWCSHDS
jgi:CO/xanthine dehydrogenase Mo-binding subunit